MARHAMPIRRGLGHLLLASPDCTIARSQPSTSDQTGPHLFPAAPIQYDSDSLGSTVEPAGSGLAQSTSSGPLFTLFALPTSLLYLAPTKCSSQLHPALPRYSRTPRSRGILSIFPRRNTGPPHRHATLLRFRLSLDSSMRFAEQLFPARIKLCYQMSQNVSGTWMADVTAPLANSPPKSRLALAVEPPDEPPRYPPFDRIHPHGSHTNCREPPLRFRLHIRPLKGLSLLTILSLFRYQ